MGVPFPVSDIKSFFVARLNAIIGSSGFCVSLAAALDSLTEGIKQLQLVLCGGVWGGGCGGTDVLAGLVLVAFVASLG